MWHVVCGMWCVVCGVCVTQAKLHVVHTAYAQLRQKHLVRGNTGLQLGQTNAVAGN